MEMTRTLVALALVAVAACSGDDGGAEPSTTTPTVASDPGASDLAVVWAHTRDSDPVSEQFAVGGMLSYDTDLGCFLLHQDEPMPVIWPTGTEPAPDGVGVELTDGTVARPGDAIRGDGNPIEANQLAAEFAIPGECLPPSGRVVSFNGDGKITVTSGE